MTGREGAPADPGPEYQLWFLVPAVLFWSNTPVLIFFTLLFVVSYVWAYVSIVRFKVPKWLRH